MVSHMNGALLSSPQWPSGRAITAHGLKLLLVCVQGAPPQAAAAAAQGAGDLEMVSVRRGCCCACWLSFDGAESG